MHQKHLRLLLNQKDGKVLVVGFGRVNRKCLLITCRPKIIGLKERNGLTTQANECLVISIRTNCKEDVFILVTLFIDPRPSIVLELGNLFFPFWCVCPTFLTPHPPVKGFESRQSLHSFTSCSLQ